MFISERLRSASPMRSRAASVAGSRTAVEAAGAPGAEAWVCAIVGVAYASATMTLVSRAWRLIGSPFARGANRMSGGFGVSVLPLRCARADNRGDGAGANLAPGQE